MKGWKLLGLLLALILITGCGGKTPPPVFREDARDLYSVTDAAFQSFNEAVTGATDVLTAQFRKYHEYEKYTELEFTVKKSFKGETTAKTIFVFETVSDVGLWGSPEPFDYTAGRHNFVKGHEYLLVLSREVSVYCEHDRYRLVGELFIPLEDAIEPHMYGRPLRDIAGAAEPGTDCSTEGVRQRVLELCETSRDTSPAYHGTMPIMSEELSVVAAESGHILLVTVEELIAKGTAVSADAYSCTVREVLKGEPELVSWKNRIFVTFRRGESEIGKEYLLLVDRLGETSKMFRYSSVGASVHPVASEEEKNALYAELGY